MEDLTGKQLRPYRVEDRLGAGGMAVVYKAYQPSMERYIALKILPRHFAADPDFVDRFKREVKIIAHLEHPHIVPVHDYGQAEGYTYLAMRYVQGGTLGDRFQGKPLPLAQMCDIVTPVAAALDYAHQRGVIHRDIKPTNGLIDQLLVKIELVADEGRFRAVGQVEIAPANSLAWDPSRTSFWAVRGGPAIVRTEIDLLDRAGQQTATFTVPETFVGYPRYAAWDGQYLWLSSNEGSLFKMEPAGDGGELRQVDSYAPAVQVTGKTEASGLTWDGNNLWVLVGDMLSKLDRAARPLCQFRLVGDVDAAHWWGWRGLAWDGKFLWVGHADASRAYRVDPAACQ